MVSYLCGGLNKFGCSPVAQISRLDENLLSRILEFNLRKILVFFVYCGKKWFFWLAIHVSLIPKLIFFMHNFKEAFLSLSLILLFIFYSNGQSSINQRDDRGLRQGLWKGLHLNGQIRYSGMFVDDKPIGVFKYFNDSGVLRNELVFHNNNPEVDATYFYPDNTKMASGKYLNKQRQGLWIYFAQAGFKIAETTYQQGLAQGLSKIFYESGQVSEEVEYLNDIKQGKWKQFFENGSTRLIASYKGGKLDGAYQIFNLDGKLSVNGLYGGGLEEGKWAHYTAEGALQKEVFFHNGKIINEIVHLEVNVDGTSHQPPKPKGGNEMFKNLY